MAIPVLQAWGTGDSGVGNIIPTWPAHQVDDVGFLVCETANQVAAAPSGWAEVLNSPQGTGTAGGTAATRLTLFWLRATSAAETNPTIVDPGNHAIGRIFTVRGCIATGDPWDVTAGDVLATAGTAVDIPGATTTVADCLVVFVGAEGTDTATPQYSTTWVNADLASVTFAEQGATAVGNGGGWGAGWGTKAVAGAYGATTNTLVTSSVQGRLSIALKPPVAGPQGPPLGSLALMGAGR